MGRFGTFFGNFEVVRPEGGCRPPRGKVCGRPHTILYSGFRSKIKRRAEVVAPCMPNGFRSAGGSRTRPYTNQWETPGMRGGEDTAPYKSGKRFCSIVVCTTVRWL